MNCFYPLAFHVAFGIGQTSLSGVVNVLPWPETFPPLWWPCLTHTHLWATAAPKQRCEREHRPLQSHTHTHTHTQTEMSINPPHCLELFTHTPEEGIHISPLSYTVIIITIFIITSAHRYYYKHLHQRHALHPQGWRTNECPSGEMTYTFCW